MMVFLWRSIEWKNAYGWTNAEWKSSNGMEIKIKYNKINKKNMMMCKQCCNCLQTNDRNVFERDELKPHYIQLLINGLLKAMKTTEPKTNWKWIKYHSEALKPSHRHISPMHGLLFLRCAENENIKFHLRLLKCCARGKTHNIKRNGKYAPEQVF